MEVEGAIRATLTSTMFINRASKASSRVIKKEKVGD